MTAQDMLLAEILALRCCVAALARETLLRQGSEAFIHAQAQADKFAKEATPSTGQFSTELRERAARIVSDVFTMADGA